MNDLPNWLIDLILAVLIASSFAPSVGRRLCARMEAQSTPAPGAAPVGRAHNRQQEGGNT